MTMDPTLRDLALRTLEQELPGIDLFSREFLFDRRHAVDRSQLLTIAGPAGAMSRLSFLLREVMPDDDDLRQKLFGDYDLGNRRFLSAEFCVTEQTRSENENVRSLVAELEADWKRDWGEEKSIDASHLKKIKQDLATLTGRSMEQHYACNKSTALKVVKLLYWLGRDDSTHENAGAGKFQIFDWLKWPEGDGRHRFSLSFRSAYPYQSPTSKTSYKTSDERSALLADLKGYLSAELTEETYAAIVSVPEELHWHLNSIEHNIEKLLVDTGRTGYEDAVKTYDYLAGRLELLAFSVENIDIPLDETLFLYLHTLEFAHFAEGYPKLLDKADPGCMLVPVAPVIDVLAKDITNGTLGMYDPFVPEDEWVEFIHNEKNELGLIVSAALREAITPAALEKATEPARRLARTHVIFRTAKLFDDEECFIFSALDVVAALSCVCHEQSKPASERTKHKPFWKGQQAQGGSILTSLDLPTLGDQPFAFYDRIPEEHRLIWTSRFEWFRDALQGHTELAVQRFRFRSAAMRRAKAIVKTNNRGGMRDAMERLNLATFELGLHFLGG
ncbi:hypothetical protein [Cupriavidus sp. SW-Y-13]|uniref:hypothetical protein n=1 Tax=Cupriavidus sp. SW-Y-13 TaxID=2653854 RepID=UPI0013667A59|nr:hypothetical protein [Cupriavidus sp. SW-Y-13]MWL88600.1 hypothetical protein [Cupriavidus sp. SW-Y-13]